MGEIQSKYHVSDDGKVFEIKDDGSVVEIGVVAKNKPVDKPIGFKAWIMRDLNWLWLIAVALVPCIFFLSNYHVSYGYGYEGYAKEKVHDYMKFTMTMSILLFGNIVFLWVAELSNRVRGVFYIIGLVSLWSIYFSSEQYGYYVEYEEGVLGLVLVETIVNCFIGYFYNKKTNRNGRTKEQISCDE